MSQLFPSSKQIRWLRTPSDAYAHQLEVNVADLIGNFIENYQVYGFYVLTDHGRSFLQGVDFAIRLMSYTINGMEKDRG